jgi:hypothetical protein
VISCVALAIVGCGSHVSADRRNEKEIAAVIGMRAAIDCRGATCDLVVNEPFRQSSEAWFIALPVVFMIDSPSLANVKKVKLTIADKRRNREAVFRCLLLHQEKVGVSYTTVADIKKICRMSFAPVY